MAALPSYYYLSGVLKPSEQDIQITDCLVKACRIFNMYLMDHVICGYNKKNGNKIGYYSMQYKQARRIYPKNIEEDDLKDCTKKESHLDFHPDAKTVKGFLKADFENEPGVYPICMTSDLNESLQFFLYKGVHK